MHQAHGVDLVHEGGGAGYFVSGLKQVGGGGLATHLANGCLAADELQQFLVLLVPVQGRQDVDAGVGMIGLGYDGRPAVAAILKGETVLGDGLLQAAVDFLLRHCGVLRFFSGLLAGD